MIADKTACITPAGHPAALAAGMNRVLRDQTYASALSQGAAQKIASWTIEAEAERIVDIWRAYLA